MNATHRWLVALVAAGEMAVGLLVALVPAVGMLLIGSLVDGAGLLVVRMLGAALVVIGLTWWLGRSDPACSARNAPGFLLYNIGVGALFALAASSASQPAVPWLLAVVHIGAGVLFGALSTVNAAGRSP